MAYKDFDGSASTQTPDERAAEAERILRRIGPWLRARDDDDSPVRGWTGAAEKFVLELLSAQELTGTVQVSSKQLFWLRDLAEAVD